VLLLLLLRDESSSTSSSSRSTTGTSSSSSPFDNDDDDDDDEKGDGSRHDVVETKPRPDRGRKIPFLSKDSTRRILAADAPL